MEGCPGGERLNERHGKWNKRQLESLVEGHGVEVKSGVEGAARCAKVFIQ